MQRDIYKAQSLSNWRDALLEKGLASTVSPQINVNYTGMDRNALVQLFNDLPYNVGYEVVGNPTINNGVVSGFSNSDYVYVPKNTLTSWEGIELIIATPTTFSTTLTTSTIFGKKDDFYIYAKSDGSIQLSFVAGNDYGLHPGNTEYYNRVKKIKLVFGANTTHRYYTIDGTTWIDSGGIAAIPNFNTYANFTFGSGSYRNAYTGSIDLNNTYIKINNVYWFRGQPAMTKTLSCVGATGTADLTAEDKDIALNKGWSLTLS